MQNNELKISLDEYNARPVSKVFEILYFSAASIFLALRLQKNKIKKIIRDYEIVKREYDEGNWR